MTKQYGFTGEGVQAFLDDILGDVMEAIHETGTYEDQLYITVGSRTMVSETYEALDTALHDALTIWNTEYEWEEKNNEDE